MSTGNLKIAIRYFYRPLQNNYPNFILPSVMITGNIKITIHLCLQVDYRITIALFLQVTLK